MKTTNARWYDEPKDNVHGALVGVFNVVREESEWQLSADEYHVSLYCATDSPGIRGTARRGYEYGAAVLPYNVCRGAVDTLQAKVCVQRPLPQVLTQRGDWKSQKKARKMTEFLEGTFHQQNFFERHWRGLIRDALIAGRGVVKVWNERERITTERVHPWELFVDPWDARYGDPRNILHVRSMDKGQLLAMFGRTKDGNKRPSIHEAIEKSGRFEFHHDAIERDTTVDRVDIIEAWHLPSYPGANDGRHVVCVQGATLVDEPWEYDYFPFVILNYNDPTVGFFGSGLVEQLEGYQHAVCEASLKLSEQYRGSGVHILVPDDAGIHEQQVTNGVTIMQHRPGATPTVFQADLVNEHLRIRPRELTEDALNDVGISQMAAQSKKPSGIQSGIALQTMDDIETQRFHVFARAAESAVLEVARRYVDCAKRIARDHGELKVSVPMKGGLIDLTWKEVELDGVELRVFPTSLLPQQLGARLERLKDLWNTGIIDRATFLRHLDAPDMQAELDLETADRLVIDEIIEKMLDAEEDEGEEAYIPPSAYQDLQWGARRANQKLNRAMLDGAPEYNLELLRRWIKETEPPPPPQDPAADPMGMAPPGPGDAPLAPPPPPTPQAPDVPGLAIPGAASALVA